MNLQQANIVELAGNAARTTTLTGSAVDIVSYERYAQVVLMSSVGTGTTPTLDVKLQHSDVSGSGYVDIPGATFAQVTDAADSTEMIQIDVGGIKRYIRVVGTIAGTTPSFEFGVAMLTTRKAGRNASQAV